MLFIVRASLTDPCCQGCPTNSLVADWLLSNWSFFLQTSKGRKPKLLQVETWNVKRMFTPLPSHLSHVTCYLACLTSHVWCVPFSFVKSYLQPTYLLKSVDININYQKKPENKICLNNLHTTTNYTIVHTFSLHFIAHQCTVVQRNVQDCTVMHSTLFQHSALYCPDLH